jgi:hypothetical protein
MNWLIEKAKPKATATENGSWVDCLQRVEMYWLPPLQPQVMAAGPYPGPHYF